MALQGGRVCVSHPCLGERLRITDTLEKIAICSRTIRNQRKSASCFQLGWKHHKNRHHNAALSCFKSWMKRDAKDTEPIAWGQRWRGFTWARVQMYLEKARQTYCFQLKDYLSVKEEI